MEQEQATTEAEGNVSDNPPQQEEQLTPDQEIIELEKLLSEEPDDSRLVAVSANYTLAKGEWMKP